VSAAAIWLAVLGCALGCYLRKLAGLSVPGHVLEKPAVRRIADLIPVALLAALIATQVLAGSRDQPALVLDARLVGLGAALVALLLRAPFIVVVFVAALAAALVRAV
jgi:branched-subunit amino acid transport protein